MRKSICTALKVYLYGLPRQKNLSSLVEKNRMKASVVPFYTLDFIGFFTTAQPTLRALKPKFYFSAFYYSNFLKIERRVAILRDRKGLWVQRRAYKIQQEKTILESTTYVF